MNARDIPFLTLGEVIARSQGVGAIKAIPGRLDDDEPPVLRRTSGATRWSMPSSRTRSRRRPPCPLRQRREEFEKRGRSRRAAKSCATWVSIPCRRGRRSTPASRASSSGRGYRIEKIAFESRPNFLVTAHLYVPDGAAGRKLPVIVNPHGHWGYKKQEPTVQSRLIGQVLHGYLAIVVDSPGFSFEGDRRIERRFARARTTTSV